MWGLSDIWNVARRRWTATGEKTVRDSDDSEGGVSHGSLKFITAKASSEVPMTQMELSRIILPTAELLWTPLLSCWFAVKSIDFERPIRPGRCQIPIYQHPPVQVFPGDKFDVHHHLWSGLHLQPNRTEGPDIDIP